MIACTVPPPRGGLTRGCGGPGASWEAHPHGLRALARIGPPHPAQRRGGERGLFCAPGAAGAAGASDPRGVEGSPAPPPPPAPGAAGRRGLGRVGACLRKQLGRLGPVAGGERGQAPSPAPRAEQGPSTGAGRPPPSPPLPGGWSRARGDEMDGLPSSGGRWAGSPDTPGAPACSPVIPNWDWPLGSYHLLTKTCTSAFDLKTRISSCHNYHRLGVRS